MDITINSCNNIDSAQLSISKNKLNIKYGPNGTGKSTIAKAILMQLAEASKKPKLQTELIPFKNIGDPAITPSVMGLEDFVHVEVFNEEKINEIAFTENDLLKGSFDIFIKGDDYVKGIREIEELTLGLRSEITKDVEIDDFLNHINSITKNFGKDVRSGIHGSSPIGKTFGNYGNIVEHVLPELEDFKPLIQGSNNSKWLAWQISGKEYVNEDNCPYCVSDIKAKLPQIDKLIAVYKPKDIEYLNNIVDAFTECLPYFSADAQSNINKFIRSLSRYTPTAEEYILRVKNEAIDLHRSVSIARDINFDSLSGVDQIIEHLDNCDIKIELFLNFKSDKTISIINRVNNYLKQLRDEAESLKSKVDNQKFLIEAAVKKYGTIINSFLENAGYEYSVDFIAPDTEKERKLVLLHKEHSSPIGKVRSHLSFGERNAFSIVLFTFYAIYKNTDLIILDDPISSFDKNKKYALMHFLFNIDHGVLKNTTTLLLTHDIDPILDLKDNFRSFPKHNSHYLSNRNGHLTERKISRNDIKPFLTIIEEQIPSEICIVSKLIYLRRKYEILEIRGLAYELLSNIIKRRSPPENRTQPKPESGYPLMSQEEISCAEEEIRKYIKNFNYQETVDYFKDDKNLLKDYNEGVSNYQKLHIFRILTEKDINQNLPPEIWKFITQSFHIENDYIYQLDPTVHDPVPAYVIEMCTTYLKSRAG